MNKVVSIDGFSTSDKTRVIDLLHEANLPVADLSDDKLKNFLVAKDNDGAILGLVGVEIYGENGLLRSLTVHPSYRGNGLGRQLTRDIESLALQNGVKKMYLLTMTAADFFPKIGYHKTRRKKVPDSIKKTAEFKSICPASAVCLFKDLNATKHSQPGNTQEGHRRPVQDCRC